MQLIQVVVVAAAVAVVAFHYYLPLSANAELYFLVWRHFHITPWSFKHALGTRARARQAAGPTVFKCKKKRKQVWLKTINVKKK